MADQHHLEILKQGAETWNQWRQDHPDVIPDLSKADLARVDLKGSYLKQTNIVGVDPSQTYLLGVDLSHAHLEGANLREAHKTPNIRV